MEGQSLWAGFLREGQSRPLTSYMKETKMFLYFILRYHMKLNGCYFSLMSRFFLKKLILEIQTGFVKYLELDPIPYGGGADLPPHSLNPVFLKISPY